MKFCSSAYFEQIFITENSVVYLPLKPFFEGILKTYDTATLPKIQLNIIFCFHFVRRMSTKGRNVVIKITENDDNSSNAYNINYVVSTYIKGFAFSLVENIIVMFLFVTDVLEKLWAFLFGLR